MGDISDYYSDVAMQQQAEYDGMLEELQQKADKALESYKMGIAEWRTKDDNKIQVSDMTNDHVRNCLNFLAVKDEDDKSPVTLAWIEIFKAECIKRKTS